MFSVIRIIMDDNFMKGGMLWGFGGGGVFFKKIIEFFFKILLI